ncbi:MAG: carboxypeptidase regulatory-like domain-containing protein [Myxococcales bacterium]|nr:carboxypeptidase regulatory-like domain-containing protein [Myxococcales bacterium]
MHRLPLALPLLFLATGLPACSGDPDPTDTSSDADSDSDTDTSSDADSDTDTDPTKATVSGRITLPDGSPAENFRVNVCRDQCLTAKTDADGAYEVSNLKAEVASFYVVAIGENPYGVPYAPITLTGGEARTIDLELHLHTGTIDLDKDGGVHTIGELATLTADGSSYVTSLNAPVDEITWTLTDGTGDRPPLELTDTEILQVIWFGEFEAEGSGTLQLNNPGLATGTSVNVWIAALPKESGWVLAGTLVAMEGQPMLQGEVALSVLTAVAITVAPM